MSSHLFEIPSFEIEGKHYQFSRLGLKSARYLIEIVKTAWKNGVLDLNLHLEQMSILSGTQGRNLEKEITPELVLFFSAEHCLEQFLDLMEEYLLVKAYDNSRVNVPYEDICDEEKFPLYSLVILGTRFISHPDLSMFVTAINEGKDLPFFRSLLDRTKKAI